MTTSQTAHPAEWWAARRESVAQDGDPRYTDMDRRYWTELGFDPKVLAEADRKHRLRELGRANPTTMQSVIDQHHAAVAERQRRQAIADAMGDGRRVPRLDAELAPWELSDAIEALSLAEGDLDPNPENTLEALRIREEWERAEAAVARAEAASAPKAG